ncbi:MAG TPA: hypothetical protein DEB06_02800 [Phycisphaerales bacterium]|nr:hypothetical protein [Phycisphaerales bacterium]
MKTRPSSALMLTLACSGVVTAQTVVDGVAFVGLAASGAITVGNVRGSIGVIDDDRDGWMDLYIANSAGQNRRLFRRVACPTIPGERALSDVTALGGLNDADGTARGFGVVMIFDRDSDGAGAGEVDDVTLTLSKWQGACP